MDGVINYGKYKWKRINSKNDRHIWGNRKKTITIEEGEDILFSPQNIKKLEQDGCDSRIIAIIWEACELEDIESLLPMRLDEIINDLKDKSLELLRINFEKNHSD